MKRMEIAVQGAREEEIAMEILKGIYGALQGHGYADVSVRTETVPEPAVLRPLNIPAFMTRKHPDVAWGTQPDAEAVGR